MVKMATCQTISTHFVGVWHSNEFEYACFDVAYTSTTTTTCEQCVSISSAQFESGRRAAIKWNEYL